jgi:hypothetical protein
MKNIFTPAELAGEIREVITMTHRVMNKPDGSQNLKYKR